jgi:hypothetical protein
MEAGASFAVLDAYFNFSEVYRGVAVQILNFALRPKSFLLTPSPVPSDAHLRLIPEVPVCNRIFPNP